MSIKDKILGAVNPTGIEDIKSTIGKRGGLAKGNRFAIFMNPPAQTLLNLDLQRAAASLLSGTFSLGGLVNDPRDISILCESCSIPGRQIQTSEKPHLDFRQTIKYPTGYFNEDVTFSFLLTGDYYMRKIFDKWQGSIINNESYLLNYRNEYVTDVVIQQYNEQNVPIYGVRLKNAFPTTVQNIELNQGSGEVQKLSVTMTYEDFEPEGALTSLVSGVKSSVRGLTKLI